jgi:hypothetical protein
MSEFGAWLSHLECASDTFGACPNTFGASTSRCSERVRGSKKGLAEEKSGLVEEKSGLVEEKSGFAEPKSGFVEAKKENGDKAGGKPDACQGNALAHGPAAWRETKSKKRAGFLSATRKARRPMARTALFTPRSRATKSALSVPRKTAGSVAN